MPALNSVYIFYVMERLVLLTVDVPVAVKRQGWPEGCDPASLASQKLGATNG